MFLVLSWLTCLLLVPPGLGGCDGAGPCSNPRLSVPLEMSVDSTSDRHCGTRCRFFVWTQWSVCTCNSRLRSRVARSGSSGCSKRVCPSRAVQTQKCSKYATAYCKLSEWTVWSTCEAGTQKRWRAVIQAEACRGGVLVPCPNNLIETRSCQVPPQFEHKIKRSSSQESELNSTSTPKPDIEDLEETGNAWWIYLIVAVICTALLLFSVSIAVHCIRHRRGRYVVKSSEPMAMACEQGEAGVQDASSSPAQSRKPLQSCMKYTPRGQRKSSGNERRGSAVNFAVEPNDCSNSSASSEAGDGPLKEGKYGIANPMVDLEETEETMECREDRPSRKRRETYDSQASREQLVWYFDDDDRYSVMQSNTEDREDSEEYVIEKPGLRHCYNNPLFVYSDSVQDDRPISQESTRLTGDGTSDSSVLEEEDRDSALLDVKGYHYGTRCSMPPADGDSEPNSPGGQGSYQPISRGHGIWQYGREVTPDGKRYTKIKATKLRLPSGQSALASDV